MKFWKVFTIIFLSVVLSTLGIGASDSWRGDSGSLLSQVIGSKTPTCPKGMVNFSQGQTFSCVDEYEAVPGDDCPYSSPVSLSQTNDNLNKSTCAAVSKDTPPWVFINRAEATLACSRAGKRLPTASEWYQFSMGTPQKKCNINSSGPNVSEDNNECISTGGVKQTVGNVWEWTSDDISSGNYNGRKLPGSGYVDQIDNGGVATTLRADYGTSDYLGGYIWSQSEGNFGMIRGGFYGSRDDAGLYTVQAQTATTFTGAAVGFRCVK